MIKSTVVKISQSLYGICTFITALFIAWCLLAKVNFFFPQLYQALEIEKTISVYGPQNRYKQGFELTSSSERIQLFSDINSAIHNNGRGLKELSYHASGKNITFLRAAEVIHLQDVADLLDKLFIFAFLLMFFWFSFNVFLFYNKNLFPPLNAQIASVILFCLTTATITLVLGPTKVFYWLHTLVFPDKHQWFFYYQDSLMTTLMKAPDIFAPISILIALLALIIFFLLALAMKVVLSKTLTKK